MLLKLWGNDVRGEFLGRWLPEWGSFTPLDRRLRGRDLWCEAPAAVPGATSLGRGQFHVRRLRGAAVALAAARARGEAMSERAERKGDGSDVEVDSGQSGTVGSCREVWS